MERTALGRLPRSLTESRSAEQEVCSSLHLGWQRKAERTEEELQQLFGVQLCRLAWGIFTCSKRRREMPLYQLECVGLTLTKSLSTFILCMCRPQRPLSYLAFVTWQTSPKEKLIKCYHIFWLFHTNNQITENFLIWKASTFKYLFIQLQICNSNVTTDQWWIFIYNKTIFNWRLQGKALYGCIPEMWKNGEY